MTADISFEFQTRRAKPAATRTCRRSDFVGQAHRLPNAWEGTTTRHTPAKPKPWRRLVTCHTSLITAHGLRHLSGPPFLVTRTRSTRGLDLGSIFLDFLIAFF